MTPESASEVLATASILVVLAFTSFVVRSISTSKTHHGHINLGDSAGMPNDGDRLRITSITTQGDVSSNYKTRILIVIGSLTAFLSSVCELGLIIAKLDSLPKAEGWIFLSGWSLVLGQAILLARERAMVKRFNIGICIALSCAALILSTLLASYFLATQESRGRENHGFFYILALVEVIGAIFTAVASISLPRQPPLYRDGKAIDAQFSSSALGRYTFSWATSLLKKALVQNSLNQSDLPELDDDTRSSSLQSRFQSNFVSGKQEQPLWYQVFEYHWKTIIMQWILTGVESFAMMLPPLCLFKILSLLEKRSSLENGDVDLWFWVACLGLSKAVHLGFETWTHWISFAILATPVRAQLSALIFTKSMHMKDVQAVEGQPIKCSDGDKISVGGVEDYERETFLSAHDQAAERDSVHSSPGDSTNGNPIQTSDIVQGPINLLGVDVQRVCNFCGYNNLLIGSLLKILLAVWFLVILIGWWSTIAGLLMPIIFHPLNQIATKHYSQATEDVMKARDKKTHLITEALHGIRQIKFSSMESQWQEIIMAARAEELAAQWRAYLWAVFLMFCWLSMPILLGAVALGTYAWLNEVMTASVAFTALAIFSSLEWTLSVVPTTLTELLDGMISIGRIQKHLEMEDMQQDIVDGENVGFENVSIKWPSNVESDGFVLRDITLDFPSKKLSVLHGKSGSGKSLLLAAIIGEAEIVSGRIYRPKVSPDNHLNDQLASSTNWIIPSATALVAQIPWIENTSLKSNILFGLPYIESRFSKVLEACALAKDLEILPDGVETEIGANGINLSGGQRWRITLARALYSRAGILILDDIFSAVDAHVSRHILLNALEGELGDGRTRILVTHHIQLVRPFASYVVELGTNGSIESSVVQLPSKVSKLQENLVPIEATGSDDLRDVSLAEPSLIKQEPKKFVEDEQREEGRVKWAVYRRYTRAFGGWIYGALTVGLFIFSSFTTLGRSYWVKVWAQHYEDIGPSELSTHSKTSLQMVDNHLNFYLGIYLLISIIAALSTAVKTIGVLSASIRASRKLFEDVTYNVLRAPLRWLDTVPVGRILNRFVSDFALVDSQLAGDFFWLAHGALGVITTVGAALFVSIYMIAPVLIVAFAALYFVNIYLDGARDIKRLEANAKSPIFEFFGSSVAGLATIRSFEKVDEYLERMFVLIDDYTRTSWYLLLVSRWMAFRQGALGVVFSLFVASLVVVIHGINASLAGFVLSFAMEYSNVAIMTVTQYADFELAMNSTERVVEYTEMLPEGQSGHSVAQSWPSKGRLVVKNLEVKYAPDLPLVLNGISFTVESCERVGVVGRTGSGKSSLTLSLFRFLQASSGSIEIDGVDISKIKLHDLRSRLAIIPQDPVLFSGTLRSNIDPFNQQCDSTIIDALKRVHLLDSGTDEVENSGLHHADQTVRGHDSEQTNVNIFRNLESPISRGGLNLSQGQRQLLCLARVIVKQPKIIVLDEATSSVDMQTDSLIQQSIREQFSNSTLLVIAHRLSTISDFDKVLVMSDGQVVEFDTPRDLMRKRAAFWELVNESGRERQ